MQYAQRQYMHQLISKKDNGRAKVITPPNCAVLPSVSEPLIQPFCA